MAAETTLPQRVVVYDGDRGKATIFETVYTDDQVQQALVRCRGHHGSKVNCRVMSASERFGGAA